MHMLEKDFNQIRLSALREITSIATTSAAASLSMMLYRKVDIAIPSIEVEEINNIPALLGEREQETTAINFAVSGEIQGTIMLTLSPSECAGLISILTRRRVQNIKNLNELELSAVKELGNIIIGSYIRMLSDGLKVKIRYSPPGFAYDMLGAILDDSLARLSSQARQAVVMQSEFIIRKKVYQGYLIFILTTDSTSVLIKALGEWKK